MSDDLLCFLSTFFLTRGPPFILFLTGFFSLIFGYGVVFHVAIRSMQVLRQYI